MEANQNKTISLRDKKRNMTRERKKEEEEWKRVKQGKNELIKANKKTDN